MRGAYLASKIPQLQATKAANFALHGDYSPSSSSVPFAAFVAFILGLHDGGLGGYREQLNFAANGNNPLNPGLSPRVHSS